MTTYAKRALGGMDLAVRDLTGEDVRLIVDYWHESPPAFLRSIGADPTKLVSRAETAKTFAAKNPSTCKAGDRVNLGLADGTDLIGYTNLNFKQAGQAYAHIHIIVPDYRGRGLVSGFAPTLLAVFRESFGVQLLFLETSPGNGSVNRLLANQGLVARRVARDEPDGMALPGEKLLYELRLDD